MTAYTYKVLLIYPVAELTNVRQFVQEYIDPVGYENWFGLALSEDGTAPTTHYAAEFHATKAQAELWLDRFAGRLGGNVPSGFTSLPKEAQRLWMSVAQGALHQVSDIYFQAVFNEDGERPDFEAALDYCGLSRISGGV